jgi:hypothetical protein
MAEHVGYGRFLQLDEDLMLAGCGHDNRTADKKETGGLNILGLQIIEPATTYMVKCKLKRGVACGYPCPINISKKKLDSIHDKAEGIA